MLCVARLDDLLELDQMGGLNENLGVSINPQTEIKVHGLSFSTV